MYRQLWRQVTYIVCSASVSEDALRREKTLTVSNGSLIRATIGGVNKHARGKWPYATRLPLLRLLLLLLLLLLCEEGGGDSMVFTAFWLEWQYCDNYNAALLLLLHFLLLPPPPAPHLLLPPLWLHYPTISASLVAMLHVHKQEMRKWGAGLCSDDIMFIQNLIRIDQQAKKMKGRSLVRHLKPASVDQTALNVTCDWGFHDAVYSELDGASSHRWTCWHVFRFPRNVRVHQHDHTVSQPRRPWPHSDSGIWNWKRRGRKQWCPVFKARGF